MPNTALSLCLASFVIACAPATRHVNPLAVARPYLEKVPQNIDSTREKWENCRGVELWTMHGGAHSPRLKHPEWPHEIVSWLFLHPKP